MYGIPVDPSPVLEIAREKGVAFIDDAAQALGASLNGKKAGSFGDLGILTFNKLLEVNLGGAVTTNDRELAGKIKTLKERYERRSILLSSAYSLADSLGLKSRLFSKMIFAGSNQLEKLTSVSLKKKYFQETNGWVVPQPHVLQLWQREALSPQIANQLMTYAGRYWHTREVDKYEAIELESEFKKTDDFVQDRAQIAGMYKELLGEGHFSAIDAKSGSMPSYIRYPILLDSSKGLMKCIEKLKRAKIEVDFRYKPLHSSPFFSFTGPDSEFDGSNYIYQHILPLPIHPHMDAREVRKVVSIVKTASS
jgi:dTDP-4-amino-4,6-dideoxygalactose transaminase